MKIINHFLITLILIISININSMEKKTKDAENLDGLGAYCAQLAKKASKKTVFANCNDVEICHIIGTNAEKILERNNWTVRNLPSYGSYCNQVLIPVVIEPHNSDNMCSIKTARKTYKRIVTILQQDWNIDGSVKVPHKFMGPSKDQSWNFYSKETSLLDEWLLIELLAIKYNVKSKIDTSHIVKIKDGVVTRNKTYLAVKKDAMDEFNTIFGFKLNSN